MSKSTLASTLVLGVQSANLAVSFSDCGDVSTHAKVTDLHPHSLTTGATTTVIGTATLDEDVHGADFAVEIKAGGVKVASCGGDATNDVVCTLPLGTGSMTVKAKKFPMKKGTIELPVEIKLKSRIPARLSTTTTHISAVSHTKDKLVCLNVNTKKASEIDDSVWEAWKMEYGRRYNGDEDFRRAVFEDNLLKAEELQKMNPEAEFGGNQFGDWTPEEFKAFLNYQPGNETLPEFDLSVLPLEIADTVDWTGKATTPVKDQGHCGSCWAFSAVEQIESDLILQHGVKVELAPQELVDCTSRGSGSRRNGCNGGEPSAGYHVIQALGGIEKEGDYRYRARNGVCKYSHDKAAVKVTDFKSVGRGSESDMKRYVASTGPLSICVDASSWQTYRRGVMSRCGQQTDHCVQLVGYGVSGSSSYWKIRNSWASSWGEHGFIRVEYGRNLCAIDSQPTKVWATTHLPPTPPTPGPTPSPTPGPTPPSPTPTPHFRCHSLQPSVITDAQCTALCDTPFCPQNLCQCDGEGAIEV